MAQALVSHCTEHSCHFSLPQQRVNGKCHQSMTCSQSVREEFGPCKEETVFVREGADRGVWVERGDVMRRRSRPGAGWPGARDSQSGSPKESGSQGTWRAWEASCLPMSPPYLSMRGGRSERGRSRRQEARHAPGLVASRAGHTL